jgi:hypothetical protein
LKDITGQVYGKLTVLSKHSKGDGGRVKWLCACECGGSGVYAKNTLDFGRSHCGCEANRMPSLSHGMRYHPLYSIWRSMIRRCTSEKCHDYPNYGGRGIKVYTPWVKNMKEFFEYMGPRPEGHSLDRIDVDGNYEPGNVRWATAKTQGYNKRNTVKIEECNLEELVKITGLSRQTLYMRKRRGWSNQEIKNGKRTSKK